MGRFLAFRCREYVIASCWCDLFVHHFVFLWLYYIKYIACTFQQSLRCCQVSVILDFILIIKPLTLCYARSGHRGLLDLRSDMFTTTTTTTTIIIIHRTRSHKPSACWQTRVLSPVMSWPTCNFATFWIGLLGINPHTKFDVSIFSRSLDMEGVPKFKSRSPDSGPVPIWPNFPTFSIGLLAIKPHTKFDVSIFSHSLDIEGVPKCKSRSRDAGHAPFDHKM